MDKPFKIGLANVFFNGRNEFCTNGATSRSRVMVARRKAATLGDLQAELDKLSKELRNKGRNKGLLRRLATVQAAIRAL